MATLTKAQLQAENEELKLRLQEAEETLRAIHEGEVDAVVVSGSKGEQIFSLVGTDSIYRLIVETMREAAFTVTFDGKILFCNTQFGEFVKRPLEQVVGHPLREFVAEEDHGAASSLLDAAQHQPVKQRLVFHDLNCKPVPAHVSANVLNQPDGLSICVVANDLTELENSTELIQQLRRQQDTLRESEARFRSVLDNAKDVIYRLNVQTGSFVYISPSAETTTGYTPAELQAQTAEAARLMIHPDDLPAMQAALTQMDRVGQSKVEYRQRTKAGDFRWLSNHMCLIRNKAGQPLYRDGTIRDITDRKRAEEAVSASELQYRRLFESAKDGILILDPETGMVVDANPFLVKLLGISRDDFLQRKIWDLGFFRDIVANQASFAELQQKDYVRYEDKPLETADGRQVDVEFVSNAYMVANRKVIQCNIRDIRERKRSEEALRKVADELARSNKDLESFAHAASHDMQEPLRMVIAFMGLLQERCKGQLDAKAQEYIGFAVDGATRMSALIRDLLAYSKVGAKARQPAPVDLTKAANSAMANLYIAVNEAGAQVTIDPLPTVTADAAQMQQLFQNLIGNAIKFRTKDRRPEIHVTARKQDSAWLIQVKDNGIGIPPDQHDRLFGIFQRLHTREEYPGTGVGLATCKKIVERHGGRIWLESEPGKGSTFCFTLPAQ